MKKIIWEKWIDPFGEDTDEAIYNNYDDDMDENISEFHKQYERPKAIRVIKTPMGIIPYNEYSASSKIYNFWMGHTNFNITKKIKDLIEKINGVEILDVFTRYRFRIAIGKAFEDDAALIMSSIEKEVNNLDSQKHNNTEQ